MTRGFNRQTKFLNPFPHDKILDQTKLKVFADDKLNVTKMIISVFDRVENIVGKGEFACISNFFFSHNVFKRFLSQNRQKVPLCGNGFKRYAEMRKCLIRYAILDVSSSNTPILSRSFSKHLGKVFKAGNFFSVIYLSLV